MPENLHIYVVREFPRDWQVWHKADGRCIAAGLDLKPALSMRDRLNDRARRATSIAPPHSR